MLRSGAGEVDAHRVPVDLDRRADLEVALGRLDGLGGLVAPVRHLRDRGAGAPLGVVPHLGAGAAPPVRPAAPAQLLHPALGEPVHGELRAQVAAALVAGARVGGDQVDQLAGQAHRREDQALLVQLGRVGRHRRRDHPADVGVVGARRGPAEPLAFDVDRRDERDVRQVRAAEERVVEHPHVAGLDVVCAHGRDRRRERAEVDGNVLGLDHEPAVGVEQRGRAVAPLLDVGRQRAVDQRGAHLLRDPAQRADRDLQLGGVHVFSSVRIPCSSAVPDQPGGTRQVVSGNSTIAGPFDAWCPAAGRSRSAPRRRRPRRPSGSSGCRARRRRRPSAGPRRRAGPRPRAASRARPRRSGSAWP